MTTSDTEPIPDAGAAGPAGPAEPQEGAARPEPGRVLAGWLREARLLAEQHGLDPLLGTLNGLSLQRGQTALKVAVLGEFNRGKSTLINTLIGRSVLPVGRLPVTRTAVRLRDGSADALRLVWPDGRQDQRRLDDEDAWSGLLGVDPDPADGAAPSSDEPQPTVIVDVAGSWLRGLGIDLVDTPGSNSGGARQLEQVRQAAASADVALFVVSAISPLGTSERRLLEEEALCRHVPCVSVALTMLDLVDPAEREEAVRQTRARVAELSGHIHVLAAPAPDGKGPELDALRALLEGFARDSDRARWRDRRIAATLADHCDTMVRIAGEAMALARLSDEERVAQVAAAEADRDRGERAWDQLRIDLTARRIEHGRLLRDLVQNERQSMLEYLHNELERAGDPRTWWERDLPLQLRRDLEVTARKTERAVLGRLAGDSAWLDSEVRRRLPNASAITSPSEYGLQATAHLDGEVSDLTRLRLAARLSAQGGALIGYLVALTRHARLPVLYGTAFSLIAGLLAESSIRSATEAQRREIDTALVRIVDESLDDFLNQASEALDALYAEVLDQLHSAHIAWGETYLTMLKAPQDEEAAQAAWLPLASRAAELASRIRAALADPKGGDR
jgi:hypothetical protein